jgi:two-component system NarL family sensor kinase
MSPDLLWLPVVTTIVFLILAAFIVSFALLFQRRQIKNMQEKQALQAQFEQASLQSQIEIQNETLQAVGQDLHDNVGQTLTVVRLYLNTLEEENQQSALQGYIEQSNELVDKAIQSLRALSKSLDSFAIKEFGLVDSISHELNRLEQSKKFATTINAQGEPYSLGYNIEIILFRITQETLNNAIKHARATQISVFIQYGGSMFILEIKDNGIGFDQAIVNNQQLDKTGSGLRNMQRRAQLIGGECVFDSQLGIGTTIRIQKRISATDFH